MTKTRRKPTKFMLLIAFLTLATTIFFLQANVSTLIADVSRATIDAMTKTAVNDAVFITLEEVDYSTLVNVSRDSSGNVTSITGDASKINTIARQTAKLAQDKLTAMTNGGIAVPLGVFSGIKWLAGYGNPIYLKTIPISAVSCDFSSSFTQAGINQTKHSIYLTVKAKVTVIIPTDTLTIISQTQVLVCESIISGKIPETYLNGILLPK